MKTRRQALKIAVVAPFASSMAAGEAVGAGLPAYWAAHNALSGLVIPVMDPVEAQRQIVAALHALAEDYAKATVTVESINLRFRLRSKDK